MESDGSSAVWTGDSFWEANAAETHSRTEQLAAAIAGGSTTTNIMTNQPEHLPQQVPQAAGQSAAEEQNDFDRFQYATILLFSPTEWAAVDDDHRDGNAVESADQAGAPLLETQPGIQKYLPCEDQSPSSSENTVVREWASRLCAVIQNRFGQVPVLQEEVLRETEVAAMRFLATPLRRKLIEQLYDVQIGVDYVVERCQRLHLEKPDTARLVARVLTLLTCFAVRLLRDDANTSNVAADVPKSKGDEGHPTEPQSTGQRTQKLGFLLNIPLLAFTREEWEQADAEAKRDQVTPEASGRAFKAFLASQPGIAKYLPYDTGTPLYDENYVLLLTIRRLCIAIRQQFWFVPVLDEGFLREVDAKAQADLANPDFVEALRDSHVFQIAEAVARVSPTGEQLEFVPVKRGLLAKVFTVMTCFTMAVAGQQLQLTGFKP